MTKTSCSRCGDCCTRYPCNLIPEDILPMACHLDIPVSELIDTYLIIDYFSKIEEEDDYFLVPKRITDNEATVYAGFSWAFQQDACIFLRDGGFGMSCSIHEAKPHGGRTMSCWLKVHHGKNYYAERWKSELGQEYLKMRGLHG